MINLGPEEENKNSRLYEQRVYGTDKQKRKRYDELLGKGTADPARKRSGYDPRPSSTESHGGIIALMAVFMVAIFGLLLYLVFGGKSNTGKRPGQQTDPTGTASLTQGVSETPAPAGFEYLAVVLSVDTEIKTIKIYNVREDVEQLLVYTGASLFYARQGSQITAAQLSTGDIVRFSCDSRDMVVKAVWADDTWEKLKVDDLEIDTETHRMTVKGRNYRYPDGVCVLSNNEQVKLSSLIPSEDKYTVRGVDDTVCEIIVTTGHGTIALRNFEDFVGGTLQIGTRYFKEVTNDGVFVVREGDYTATISHDEYQGTEEIKVERDKETIFDVYEYGRGSIHIGNVYFTVSDGNNNPIAATLYINGKKTEYAGIAVALDYGTYDLEIEAGGFETQTTKINVDRDEMRISLYLTATAPFTPTPTPEPTVTPDAGLTPGVTPGATPTAVPTQGGTTSASVDISTMGFTLDPNHLIFVMGPEGAELQLTNTDLSETYNIGTVPCDFQKILSNNWQMIILYNGQAVIFEEVDGPLPNDGADVFYNFADRFSTGN